MSEIPFVKQLGDSLERAIEMPVPVPQPRKRRRRRVVVAFAVFLLGATGTTIAQVAGGPDDLPLGSADCYWSANLESDSTIVNADGKSPVEACAVGWRDAGRRVPPLVACQPLGDTVAVFPGQGAATCRRLGLRPATRSDSVGSPRLARLSSAIASIENGEDCLPPREMARRVQALLDRERWSGWRTRVSSRDRGPCGWVRTAGGTSVPSLTSAVRADLGEIRISRGAPRSLQRRLYGEGSIVTDLVEVSGRRCFTLPDLRRHARAALEVTGRPVRFTARPLPADRGMSPAIRQRRYAQGCAVVIGLPVVYPAPGEMAVEVQIARRD